MKLLHISSEYPPQQVFGLGRYVCDLSRELSRQGHEVHVLTNSIGGANQDVVDQGVHVHRVHFPPPPIPPGQFAPIMAFNLHLQQRAHSLGRDELGCPDVIISHDWLTVLAGTHLAQRFDVPHVWTVHDTVIGKRRGKLEVPDQFVYELETFGSQSANLILANSQAVACELQYKYGCSPDKLRVLPCAVYPRNFQSTQGLERLKEFRKLFAAPEESLITYVGRLDLEKGIDCLINAFRILQDKNSASRLAIIGKGDLEPVIQKHILELALTSSVTLYGYLSGEVLNSVYAISDVHVCPSLYEPFGIVALEAMASGACVVVSDTGGLSEIVKSDKFGRKFRPGDPEDLAQILLSLSRQPKLCKNIGKAAQRHVNDQYSWKKMAKSAVALYAEPLCRQ